MEMIIILLVLYAFVFMYLIRHAAGAFREEWRLDRKYLICVLLLFMGVFALLLLADFVVLDFNREHAGSAIVQLNVLLGVILFSGLLALFAQREIFAVIMGVLYIFDLFFFHHTLGKATGKGVEDFSLIIGSMFNYFINLSVFAAAFFLDRAVQLEQLDDTIF